MSNLKIDIKLNTKNQKVNQDININIPQILAIQENRKKNQLIYIQNISKIQRIKTEVILGVES